MYCLCSYNTDPSPHWCLGDGIYSPAHNWYGSRVDLQQSADINVNKVDVRREAVISVLVRRRFQKQLAAATITDKTSPWPDNGWIYINSWQHSLSFSLSPLSLFERGQNSFHANDNDNNSQWTREEASQNNCVPLLIWSVVMIFSTIMIHQTIRRRSQKGSSH